MSVKPRKILKKEEETTVSANTSEAEPLHTGGPPIMMAPKSSDTVTVKVLIGTLQWEEGIFQKGNTFTVSRERLRLFDPTDIQVIEE